MATIKKYNGSTWENAVVRKYGTASEIITPPTTIYADGTAISTYSIKGNTVQSGTPTPSNPITINGVGNKTANLLNNSDFLQGGWDAAAGTTPEANQRSNRCRYSYFFSILSPTVYYDFKDLNVNIVMVDSNGVSLGGSDFRTGTGSFTVLNNTDKISLIIANTDLTQNITPEYVQSKNISLDYGYEIPISSGSTTTPIYISQQLYKIGDATDDYSSSGTATYNNIQLVLTGMETGWNANGTGDSKFFYFTVTDEAALGTSLICNQYEQATIGSSNTDVGIGFAGTVQLRIRPNNPSQYNSATDFANYLKSLYQSGTPIILYYTLATPTTESVTAPSIPTTEGANSITVDTTVQPSEFTATWTGWHDSSVKEYDGTNWQ